MREGARRASQGDDRAPAHELPGHRFVRAYTPNMSMARLMVNVAVLEWAPGDIVEVERSRMVAGLIDNGYVTELDADVPDYPAPRPAPAFPALIDVPPALLNAIKPVGNTPEGTLGVSTVAVPPRSGKGSGAPEWRRFLRAQGLEMTDRIGGIEQATKPELVDFWDSAFRRQG